MQTARRVNKDKLPLQTTLDDLAVEMCNKHANDSSFDNVMHIIQHIAIDLRNEIVVSRILRYSRLFIIYIIKL